MIAHAHIDLHALTRASRKLDLIHLLMHCGPCSVALQKLIHQTCTYPSISLLCLVKDFRTGGQYWLDISRYWVIGYVTAKPGEFHVACQN